MKKKNPLILEVMQEKCNECLFTENRIVRKGRVAEIIKQCSKKGAYFVCHKSSLKRRTEQTMCRGFYDTQDTFLIRMANQMKLVKFMEEKDL